MESPLTIRQSAKRPLPTLSRLSHRTHLQPPTRVTIPTTLQCPHWSLPTQACLLPLSQAKLKPNPLQTHWSQQREGPVMRPSWPVTSATNNSTSSRCFSVTKWGSTNTFSRHFYPKLLTDIYTLMCMLILGEHMQSWGEHANCAQKGPWWGFEPWTFLLWGTSASNRTFWNLGHHRSL